MSGSSSSDDDEEEKITYDDLRDTAANLTRDMLLEFSESTIEAVLEAGKSVPCFGACVVLLHRLSEAVRDSQRNKESCERIGVWAKGIKAALVMAWPTVQKTDDSQAMLTVMVTTAEDVGNLRTMVKSYNRRKKAIQLVTASAFKTKFEKAERNAETMLDCLVACLQAVQLKITAQSVGNLSAIHGIQLINRSQLDNVAEKQNELVENAKKQFDNIAGQQNDLFESAMKQLNEKLNNLDSLVASLQDVQSKMAAKSDDNASAIHGVKLISRNQLDNLAKEQNELIEYAEKQWDKSAEQRNELVEIAMKQLNDKLDDVASQQNELTQHLKQQLKSAKKFEEAVGKNVESLQLRLNATYMDHSDPYSCNMGPMTAFHLIGGSQSPEWDIAKMSLARPDVLTETEYREIVKSLWKAMPACQMRANPASRLTDPYTMLNTEQINLGLVRSSMQGAIRNLTGILKLDERGVKLCITNVTPDGALFELQWPSTGPFRKASEINTMA